MRRSVLAGLVLALCCAASAALAQPQYPQRPIRLLVPNPPGGATDILARIVAPRLGEVLGQPVVVENRPGSNGNLSSELTARAAPDGYTLLLCADSQIVINPHLYRGMAIDPLRDLLPVATLVSTQMLLTVNASLPVADFASFVAHAREARPPLAYASIGNGSQHHLAMEMLKVRAGIDLLHVPYKGGGPATAALLGGEVVAMFGGNSVAAHVKSGRLRPLALAGARRSASYPGVPTIGEIYPGYDVTTWLGLCGPAGLSEAVLARLRGEVARLLGDPAMQERLRAAGGMEPFPTAADEFAARVRADFGKYGEVVKQSGAKVD